MAETLFYLLAFGALASGIGVVSAKMPIFSVLSLLGAFFCLSAIYLLAGFQFLAVTQLLVYAGAIMVLFLFVIMLLNLGDPDELQRQSGTSLSPRKLTVAGATAAALGLLGIVGSGFGTGFEANSAYTQTGLDELDHLAAVLFSRYALPFEAASLLLLATMVGVICLAKRQRGPAQAPPEQEEAA